MVASNASKNPCRVAESFIAQVIIMNHPGQIHSGYTPVIDCHTCHISCKFDEILERQDKRTGKVLEEKPQSLKQGDGALIKLVPTKPMVVETFHEFPPLGRFAIRDSHRTIGVGIVKSVCKIDPNQTAPPAK
jgi:elongation factor 1-alpha